MEANVSIYEKIIEKIDLSKSEQIIIGISGTGGSGKTTICSIIKENLTKENISCAVVPMDGYHKYLSELSPNELLFRGCFDSFNIKKFTNDIRNLKINSEGKFPSFDHSIKDPKEDDIIVDKNVKIVLIEGLYLFFEEVNILDIFDVGVYLTVDLEKSIELIAQRNYKAGISYSYEESLKKTINSDKLNSEAIIKNFEKVKDNIKNCVIINFIN